MNLGVGGKEIAFNRTQNLRCLLGTEVISLVGWGHPREELQKDNMRVAYFLKIGLSFLSLYKDLKSFRK